MMPADWGALRRLCRGMTASHDNGRPPTMMGMPMRRIHAEYAVVAALICTASGAVGGAQLPVATWLRSEWPYSGANEPMHGVTARMDLIAAPIGPAPVGDITPDPPPDVPPPTVKPLVPSVAAPPPRAAPPRSPPQQEERPAPQPQGPAPAPQESPPQEPPPQPQAPPPRQESPAPQPPPRGHVQLAP
jgi:hypothetical protein